MLKIIDIFLHVDKYLSTIISNYGMLTYALLFLVIFLETGLVITPFLPGDSLLFAAGSFAAIGSLNFFTVYFVILIAAILGDTVNYEIGKLLGEKVEQKENLKLIKREHIEKTKAFFDKHGGKSIVIARFVPIVRTFAPFVAGSSRMEYKKFIKYNILGSILWVTICTVSGYFFGNIPFVKENFSLVIIMIILISLLPMIIPYILTQIKKFKNKK